MLNYIWFGLMAVALIVAIFTGNAAALTKASVESAKTAVEISLGLVGIMTLWLGIMRVAEQAGLVSMLSRILRPISRILFPEVPPDHPAIGAMVMSVSANMLGLNNAATPLGIKAMEELQELNPDKETASNPMKAKNTNPAPRKTPLNPKLPVSPVFGGMKGVKLLGSI